MLHWRNNLTKAHCVVLLAMLLGFMVWTFLIADTGIGPGVDHGYRVLQTTFGTIAGPLAGAISRGFQQCCLEASLMIMAYCSPVLFTGIAIQFVPLGKGKVASAARMALWIVGWLVWFMGGIVSFGHALS